MKKSLDTKTLEKLQKTLQEKEDVLTALRNKRNDLAAEVRRNNSRSNRKAAGKAKIDVEHAEVEKNAAREKVAVEAGRLAVAQYNADHPDYRFPNKKRTVNKAKTRKAKNHKAKRHPAPAKEPLIPSEAMNCFVDGKWEDHKEKVRQEKAIRRTKKKTELFKAVRKMVEPKYTMDEEYLIQIAWEAIEAGQENGYLILRDILKKDVTADNVEPADVDPGLYKYEMREIAHIERKIKDIYVRFDLADSKYEKAKAAEANTKQAATVAKGLHTRAVNRYVKAVGEVKVELYKKMKDREHEKNDAVKLHEYWERKLKEAEDSLKKCIDWCIKQREILDEELERAKEQLEIAKKARAHQRRQEALEEAFCQRYERAEYVPEKEEASRYKMYSIPPKCLFDEEIAILDEMWKLVEEHPAGWIQQGKTLYQKLVALIKSKSGKFSVDVRNCTINNVSASQMSDLMGVEYGAKTPCREMVKLTYDVANVFRVFWKFMGNSQEEADHKLHNLRAYVLERLVKYGCELTDGTELFGNFDLLAANNSMQKLGCAIFGEEETMKRTEKLREFGWVFKEALEHRTDNASEWLKRNAILTTPSKIIKIPTVDENGNKAFRTTNVMRILMVKNVDIERWCNNVTTIDGKALTTAQKKKLKMTMFDGQAVWLIPNAPTTQGRGPALKYMAVAMPDYKLPEFAIDIMGNKVRVADYDILMTESCWKANKMGWN